MCTAPCDCCLTRPIYVEHEREPSSPWVVSLPMGEDTRVSFVGPITTASTECVLLPPTAQAKRADT
jgi:hypothetical protein